MDCHEKHQKRLPALPLFCASSRFSWPSSSGMATDDSENEELAELAERDMASTTFLDDLGDLGGCNILASLPSRAEFAFGCNLARWIRSLAFGWLTTDEV